MINKLDITDHRVASQVLGVQLPSYRIEAELIGSSSIPGLYDTAATLAACGESFYGYFVDGVLAGAIAYKEEAGLNQGIIVDIHRLLVHPDYFRRGIGAGLVQHLFDLYGDRAVQYLVRTGARNSPAKQLYLKLGFVDKGDVNVAPQVDLTVFEK